MFSRLIHKHYSCVFQVKHNKTLLLLASYFRSYLFEKNICISDLLIILVCGICYNARKINSFTHKGEFIKSGNFSISQGKLDSFKEVRGR